MEPVRPPKVNLSFSIENILRDDFCHRYQRANGCNLSQHESSFGRWSNAAIYPSPAVHHGAVIVKSLPNGLQGQILFEEYNRMADCSSYTSHELALRHKNGKSYTSTNFLTGKILHYL